ncbi:hypothetical protein IJI69_02990 [Candidatus Saccharibacteria bacterium]|nr:hypothetical protein [Candidatus Saccharibacteria bacterium]
MTENLRLTLSTATTLTNIDTNLTTKSSWTPDRSSQTATTGRWVADWPNITDEEYNTARSFINSTYISTTDGDSQKAGGYYNWYAATAGSGNTSITGETEPLSRVRDSICPKGWIMPMAITHDTKSLDNLLDVYGITNTWTWQSVGLSVITSNPISLLPSTSGQYNSVAGWVRGVEGGNTGYWIAWGDKWQDGLMVAQVLSFEYTGTRYIFATDVRVAGMNLRCVNGW